MKSFEEMMSRFPDEIIDKLKKTEQNPKWHPEGVVWEHSKIVYNKLKDSDLKIAALFHDLGKIQVTKKNKSGDWTAPGHDKYAVEYIDKYSNLFPEAKNWDKIRTVSANHMNAHYYANGEMRKAKAEAFEKTPYFDDIMTFEIADKESKQ